jgi:DNA repair exonuclease SbcCD ATPase subunit
MIEFKEVEYKNIQSAGNHPIKISLDQSQTVCVGGSNGSGKSLLLQAITYCLFGKTLSGIKLSQAINSINKKNLLVKTSFVRNGEDWQVVRGEKPKKFEIWRNGETVDQYANARDQQKFLEIILGMDFKTFTQIVVLNKERYTPFMEMSAADRRKVVEDVLDISVFTVMNDVVKQELKAIKRDEANIDKEREVKRAKMDGQQRLIAQIRESIAEGEREIQNQIDDYHAKICRERDRIEEADQQLQELSVKGWKEVKTKLKEFNSLATDFDAKVKTASKGSHFFAQNDHCPTCEQGIDEDLRQAKIKEFDTQIKEVRSTVGELVEEIEKISQEDQRFAEIDMEINELQKQVRDHERKISHLMESIESVENRADNGSQGEKLEENVNLYEQMDNALEELTDSLRQCIADKELYDELRTVLADDGVKSFIIKDYIELINKKINDYLNSMGFYLNMRIDENFRESFHSINRDGFTYENLSTGQKTRVSIAIWLALLEVASVKNSVSTNLVMIDEILEPLDAEGVKDVMRLFADKLKHKNVFVITQRFDEFEDMFESALKFSLNNGFTEMEVA